MLAKVIEFLNDEGELRRLLSSFSCEQDDDIQYFLENRAIEFEQLSKARTYLAFDGEQLQKQSGLDSLIIYGYISLALKVLSVPEENKNISNHKRRDLDGFNAKCQGKVIEDFPCYLSGQLARNSDVDKMALPGEAILQKAFDIIQEAANAVCGRLIMVECKDDVRLIQFYSQSGFEEISRIADGETKMVQLVKRIF